MMPQPIGLQPMRSWPRKLKPNDILLYGSLGIEFYETLFFIIFNHKLYNRFNQIFETGLHRHYDLLFLILFNQDRLNYFRKNREYQDDNNIIKLDEFFRNDLFILVIGLTMAILTFIIEVIRQNLYRYLSQYLRFEPSITQIGSIQINK